MLEEARSIVYALVPAGAYEGIRPPLRSIFQVGTIPSAKAEGSSDDAPTTPTQAERAKFARLQDARTSAPALQHWPPLANPPPVRRAGDGRPKTSVWDLLPQTAPPVMSPPTFAPTLVFPQPTIAPPPAPCRSALMPAVPELLAKAKASWEQTFASHVQEDSHDASI